MNIYDRDSIEFCAVYIAVNGVAPDPGDVEFAIAVYSTRPAVGDWVAPVSLDGAIGVMVDGPVLGVGEYEVWVRVTANPETPVLKSEGGFRVV
jgi:hypothetical protein